VPLTIYIPCFRIKFFLYNILSFAQKEAIFSSLSVLAPLSSLCISISFALWLETLQESKPSRPWRLLKVGKKCCIEGGNDV
jgi:hypothetical protein